MPKKCREALRTKLTFEEVLVEYQSKFGEEATFKVRLVKRLSSIKVEIIVEGESYNALVKNSDEGDVIQGLLAGIGLAPTWNYKNGKNYIVLILPSTSFSAISHTMRTIPKSVA